MNVDLEETLDGMEPECRAVVARLKAARELDPGRRISCGCRGVWFRLRFSSVCLTAASLLLVAGLTVVWRGAQSRQQSVPAPRDYRLSVDEMIATQGADGGWQNDFLTRHNAAALKDCDSPSARIAYKKAMRNLRLKGAL